jgi:hypothetical protein
MCLKCQCSSRDIYSANWRLYSIGKGSDSFLTGWHSDSSGRNSDSQGRNPGSRGRSSDSRGFYPEGRARNSGSWGW